MQSDWKNIKFRISSRKERWCQDIAARWNRVRAWMKSKMRKRIPADELLSPKLLKKGDKLYASALQLEAALRNDDCKNIAITGMFGSGKSSVIRTALKRISKDQILSISFVNYKFEKKDPPQGTEMQGVENKIFQHILYKASESRTSKSSFRRLVPHSRGKVVGFVLWLITILLSVAVLLHIHWMIIPSSWYDFYLRFTEERARVYLSLGAQSLSFANIIVFLAVLLYKGYFLFSKIHIRSIEAKNVKIELGDIQKVNFDKILGEILYYLRAGGYRVVVFEDLDRIKVSNDLFIKLREINILLNESFYHRDHNRVTHFIYAIRDDVYRDDMRTKCFDYVIPVVPIVDKNNIEEYLANMQSNNDDKVNSIDKRDLLRLGTYISGKRALNNIFNEYMMYRAIIDTKNSLSKTNFLALIIYKNLFPHDFSLIYERKGCLYSLFSNKKKFADAINQSNVNARKECEEGIEDLKNELIKQRKVIVDYLTEEKLLTYLKVEERMIPIAEFAHNEALFQKIVHGDIRECVYQDEEKITYDVKFDDILAATKEMDFAETHAECLERLSLKQKEKLDIEKSIAQTEASTLREMLKQLTSDEGKKILGGICDEAIHDDSDFEMSETEMQSLKDRLYELVVADYINEQYGLFISVPYTGMLTEDEIAYLHAILRREESNWFKDLPNVGNLINRLNIDDFSDTAILNFDILKYLLALENPTSDEKVFLNTFINTSRKEPFFIIEAESRIPNYRLYIDKIFEDWQDSIREITKITDTGQQNTMFRLFFMAAPEMEFSERDRQTLSAYYGLINSNVGVMDLDKLSALLRRNQIKFSQIVKPQNDAQTRWYEYVVNHESFAISLANLTQIYGEDFNKGGLTLIYEDKRVSIKRYLLRNLDDVMRLLPEADTEESEDTIQEIINNERADENLLEQFVIRQKKNVDLAGIISDGWKKQLLNWNKVNPTWGNVADAYSSEAGDDELIEFIHRNAEELSAKQCDVPEKNEIGQWMLLDNDDLQIEDYQKLAPMLPIKVTAAMLGEDEETSMPTPERMRVLIQQKYLEYGKDMNKMIHTNYSSEVFAEYIVAYYEQFEVDEDFDEDFSNTDGKMMLSYLPEDKKTFFLEKYFILREDELDREEYAQMACEAYAVSNSEIGENEKDDLFAALAIYPERPNGESWRLKIGLINRILTDTECGEEEIIKMITILGGGYLDLLYAPKFKDLESNNENWQLLPKLKSLYPQRISKVYKCPIDESMIRVTFRANSAQKSNDADSNSMSIQ